MTRLMQWARGLALATTLAVAACGGGGTGAGAEKPEDVLRRGISAKPDTVDPHKASGQWENIIIGDMFMGLFTDDAAAKPVLGLAESYEIDETGTVWTFELREATWSDGVPITAEDFVYSFRRILNPETASQYASLLYLIKNSQDVYNGDLPPEELGVRAIDADTLEISLEYPAPYLPGLLKHYTTFAVPRHVIDVHGDRWTRPENIVTSGPYKLTEWRTGDYLKTVVNERWDGAQDLCFREVYYYPYEDLDAVERFIRTGKMDINNAFEGQRKAELQESLPGWVRTLPALITTYYAFNTDLAPFDDVRVRNALAMAIDRRFITDSLLATGYVPAFSLVPPGMNNYPGGAKVSWADIPVDKRRAEAKRLLEQAGFGPDNPLEFTYIYRSTDDNPKVAPVILQDWQSIADWVRPTIEQQDTAVHYNRLRKADFEVGDAAWVADYNDPQNFLYLLDSATGQMNYGQYANPQFDALLAMANNERDLTVRGNMLQSAEQLMLDDMPIIPLWYQVSKNLVDPELTGFVDNPEDIHRSRFLCRTTPDAE